MKAPPAMFVRLDPMLILLGTAVLFPVTIVGFALWECGGEATGKTAKICQLGRPVLGATVLWFLVLLLAMEPISRSVAAEPGADHGVREAAFAAAATFVIVAFGFRAVRAWRRHRPSPRTPVHGTQL